MSFTARELADVFVCRWRTRDIINSMLGSLKVNSGLLTRVNKVYGSKPLKIGEPIQIRPRELAKVVEE